MWKWNFILSFTASFASLPVSSLSVGGEQRFLDSSLLLSKESKMIGDEILKLLAQDQAPILLICLPPPAERLMLRERLGAWRNYECSNRLFLKHGRKVECFGGRCRLDLYAIIRFDTSPILLQGGVSELCASLTLLCNTVNSVHYSLCCIE